MLFISEFVCEINFGFQLLFSLSLVANHVNWLASMLASFCFLLHCSDDLICGWSAGSLVVRSFLSALSSAATILTVQLVRHERRLRFVLPGYMSPDGVVAGERSTAVGTWHTDTLMSLADVGA